MEEDDQRSEWRRIGEEERKRRKALDELRIVMEEEEAKTKKTAKSLLRVVLHAESITVNDAANMRGVSRDEIVGWAKLLRSKRLVEVVGSGTQNPTLKPANELMKKLLSYKQKKDKELYKQSIQDGFKELAKKKTELAREREGRIQVEEELEKTRARLKESERELAREENKTAGLEDEVRKLEAQSKAGSGSEMEETKAQLERERKERGRIEELLKKEREELGRVLTEEAELFKERAGGERKAIDAVTADSSDINDFISLLERKNAVRTREAAVELGVTEDTITGWVAILSDYNAVEVRKHITGGDDISLNQTTDLRMLKETLEKKKRTDDLRRIREEGGEAR